jgi:diguanylate cyclase (GGDEF)-like protein/PAS domain S-box-containing protein
MEFRKRHKNGHYVWLGSMARVLLDRATNERIGTVSVTRDITSERQAKEELRTREERFRSLTNLSSDWYWETDENHRFTFVSEGLQRLFGLAPEDVLGKTRFDLAFAMDQPGLQEYAAKISSREPFRDIRYGTVGSGGLVRYANISGEPIFDNGVFKGYRGIGRDMTQEIAVAEKLARLAKENKALVENSLDIMVMCNPEGLLLRVNEAVREILGYQPEEVIGRHHAELAVPEEREITRAMDATLRSSGNTVRDFENRCVHKDGGIVHLSWSVRLSEDKKLTYATARDVTGRYRAKAALQQSKDRLTTVLESIGDAFFAVDRDWRITYANRKAAQFAGIALDAAIGKVVWEVAPNFRHSSVFPHYRKAMETGMHTFFETYFEPNQVWLEIRVYPHNEGLSVYFHDVTQRHVAESAIRNSEQRFREVIEMTPAGYILADAHSRLIEVNPALCSLSGYVRQELIGRHIEKLFSTSPCGGAFAVKGGPTSVHAKEVVLNHKQGHPVHVLININIKRDDEGNGVALTIFLTDITERKQAEARLQQLATHDTLTGLPNRALLNERLQQMMDGMRELESVAVMFIDLDRFKEVNDSMGHKRGDILLREVGHRLKRSLRPEDIIARLGGDEFVVAAHCSRGADSAMKIAEKLFAALAAPMDIADQEVFVGASIGISLFPQDGQNKELLYQNADTAMYRAKAAGRNGYRFFETEMSVEARMRMVLEHSLPRALERDEFELHYQPRIDLKTMSIVGMEALIRWNHPQLGRVPPLQFIPIAEERGLIEPIGRWVLEQACMRTRELMDKYQRPLCVSVNLSARQLRCKDIVAQVEACLKKTGLPPHLLELELTESTLIEDMDVSAGVLHDLKTLGILLSVDDFGTGYSGLAYLRRFPLDTLKLDRSFVVQDDDAGSSFRFIKAFVDLAHALNLSVVAEGVETNDTLRFLRQATCDEAQGYLFAKPLTLEELDLYLSHLPSRNI